MQNIPLTTEEEAAVAILFSCIMSGNKQLSQAQIEQISRMLVLSSKFRSPDLNELTRKALTVQAQFNSRLVIEHAAPLITPEFSETLFAMCCELMTSDGKVDESETEILAMTALYLGMSVENMKMILATYLIRNRWNVQIVENQ